MRIQKTFILTLLGIITMSSSSQAQMANPEVIYKIHDITPLKNEMEKDSCNFSITFYNRAPQMVSNLSLNFSWLDDVIDNQIKEEKQEKFVDEKNNISGYTGQSKTEEYTAKKISVDVSVPPLAPRKQISIKSNIKTDRCFLLLQKPELAVRNCRYGSVQSDENAAICKNLFTFISPEQGEYYSEFKAISYAEESEKTESKAKKEKEELEKIYENALHSVKRVQQTLNSMN